MKLNKLTRILQIFFNPLYILAIPIILLIRVFRPFIKIRFGTLHSEIFGIFAINPELILCNREAGIDQPKHKTIDIWYFGSKISNTQLALMWKRVFFVLPFWLIRPLLLANKYIPGGMNHLVEKLNGRDFHNLFDRYPVHINFSEEEELYGMLELEKMGITAGAKFVTILARDSVYTREKEPDRDWSYHDYRNTDVNSYVKAAQFLVNAGYFVIRMGSKVKDKFEFQNKNVIDYATNGTRSDFMDIYLGAKCEFCITMGSGWDSIPFIFRKPIVYVNLVPIGYIYSYSTRYITISKKYFSIPDNRELTLKEIVSRNLHNFFESSQYINNGIKLIENTPEEIYDVVIEMFQRLNGNWESQPEDDQLQKIFWMRIPKGDKVHGEFKGRYGAAYLRKNVWWLS